MKRPGTQLGGHSWGDTPGAHTWETHICDRAPGGHTWGISVGTGLGGHIWGGTHLVGQI